MTIYKTGTSGIRFLWIRSRGAASAVRAGRQVPLEASSLNHIQTNMQLLTQAASAAAEVSEASSSGRKPLSGGEPYFTQVKSRGVISLRGPDVFKFLQGLVTNDVTRLEKGPGVALPTPSPTTPAFIVPPIYTALLNPQGRFLYDLFLYRPARAIEKLDRSGSGPGNENNGVPYLVADVDVAEIDELVSLLKRHRLRAKVDIENLSDDLKVWQNFGAVSGLTREENNGSEAGSIGWAAGLDNSGQRTAGSDEYGWRWFKDPRLPELGLRGVFSSNSYPPLVTVDQTVGDEYYVRWRLEQGVAEGSKEIPKGDAIPLEYNLAGLNAISFEKGCYVGQELIARTYHRGVIRKRLMPVNFVFENAAEDQAGVPPGVDILDTESNKKVGKVTTALGPYGLALIRLDAAERVSSNLKLDISGRSIQVKAVRPKWWPAEWGGEQRQSAAAGA
ncbi:hypothetical protein R1flu_021177 [Riccia fluitans]|uniref:CAF17 C-terminal domain-containing protein n=1 Tax=Riccia fluitans TaxID=41844 RepID=A0ABD1ZS22_9MARC